ncbi:asparaginase [Amycolatopsis solani]|uniref:asparaginase n=1 Tax=Amycolatopsis solani TaxID=3028615 RepID=UPI0025B20F66|nr:asparaginase [Amycolatopsis sp. MEP2-6]
MSDARPKVAVFATGGTMASPAEPGVGSIPRLTAEDLVATVPDLADISAISFRQVPSFELTVPDLVDLVENIGRQVSAGATGAVVVQGSDCLEEIAFLLDLLWDGDQPIVVTGAMRNDEIHAARFVHKTHTSSTATFRSTPTGPIGWVSEGNVRLAVRPIGRHHVWPDHALAPSVALLKVGFGDDGRLLSSIAEGGYSGLVVEALGGGHVPRTMVEPLEQLAARMPVVLASRTGSGEVLTRTYGFPGSASSEQVAEAFLKVGTPGNGDFLLGKPSWKRS